MVLKQSFYLRDTLDVMSTRKIREATDFDWRRNTRLYYQEIEGIKSNIQFIRFQVKVAVN